MEELMHADIQEVILSEEEIQEIVLRLGEELNEAYRGKFPLVIGVLKGSAMFMADLIRAMNCDLEIDFIAASSYGEGTISSGEVKILKDVDQTVKDRHVLLVEDIIDTGHTLTRIRDLMVHRHAASVKIVSFLNKQERREVALQGDYIGLDIPDKFVVGYGMDFNERYRELPYLGVLKPEIYQ